MSYLEIYFLLLDQINNKFIYLKSNIYIIFAIDNQFIMSHIVFYIKLEPYLKQWLHNSLGNPVVFPPQSNENAVIRRFLRKRPPEVQPEMAENELTAIVIPDSKAKPPQYYNYLGKKAKAAVKETIEDLFRANLWNEMSDLTKRDCGLNKTIAAWCEMHGIDDDYSETVRQKYYRMRTSYSRRGIFLGSLTRKHSDE